ncbi:MULTISPECIES: type II secretion system protein N [unclassified Moraxella]|uniref:type II secretion system protein N n=1 Tax=unclassified Moraxella TaxID=2685852 RepID=UPI003AF73210
MLQSRPTKLWWLVGLVLLCVFLLIQLPAQWLLNKFSPNNPYLQQVSGNLWQGQANWQVMTQPNAPLTGTAQWQWQPWHILTGKFGSAVTIRTGKTELKGQVKLGKDSWQANDFSGKITADTLRQIVNWQLPDTPITIKEVSLAKSKQGFDKADGTLNWAGGEMSYPTGGRSYKMNLPNMQGGLSVDKGNAGQSPNTTNANVNNGNNGNATSTNGQRLHLALTNPQGQRFGDFYIDNDNMLDVALTQRFLKNMPEYKGQGVDDSVVVSIRQPLTSMGQ